MGWKLGRAAAVLAIGIHNVNEPSPHPIGTEAASIEHSIPFSIVARRRRAVWCQCRMHAQDPRVGDTERPTHHGCRTAPLQRSMSRAHRPACRSMPAGGASRIIGRRFGLLWVPGAGRASSVERMPDGRRLGTEREPFSPRGPGWPVPSAAPAVLSPIADAQVTGASALSTVEVAAAVVWRWHHGRLHSVEDDDDGS